jgi:asparagine synthase (glutamine-hydrolysing)
LAIIDLSAAGHQPMRDQETGSWITYNGETYNFEELRREIGNEFGAWRSNCDTEVVLRAYRKWGVRSFSKLRGMFALAIWDAAKDELILARDAFGIKPLYYSPGSGTSELRPDGAELTTKQFAFASEVRALLASNVVPGKLSAAAVKSYLEFGSVQAPLSIVEDCWSVMPGHCLTIKRHDSFLNVSVSPFSKFSNNGHQKSAVVTTPTQAESELRILLKDSVSKHLTSDVPMGVFLSGGMDSSAIVAMMSEVYSERPKTFSVVFDEEKFNEAPHSRLIAQRFGTAHTEVHLNQETLLQQLPDAIAALDQPSMDGTNTYVVSKAVKNAGITVALSGLGGDELFCGYPSFRRALRLSATSGVTKSALNALSRVGRLSGGRSVQLDKFWQLASSRGNPEDVYRITRQLFAPAVVLQLFGRQSQIRGENGPQSLGHDDVDPVNEIAKLEMNGYMSNTLLRDTDSMSMAHSLEVRVPFVDMEVVSFMRQLPGEWKLKSGDGPKPLLASVLKDLVPPDLLKRRKMGFTLPFEKWMTANLRDEISNAFADSSLWVNAGLDQENANGIWLRFLNQPKAVSWSRPWALYVLAKWCQVNDVTA